jgi:MoaA/NifB/PqqE/SkfB family radical SAM enzyme
MSKDWRKTVFPATFTWDLWYFCNYRCSYCWFEAEKAWAELARRYPPLPVEKWVEAWERIHSLYGTVRIDVGGGEPLLFPRGDELFGALSRRHRLQITTNLSLPAAGLDRLLRAVTPDRVQFQASFHPEFSDLPAFLEKLAMLKTAGFSPSVLYVTWPPSVAKMGHYRDLFAKAGCLMTVMAFQGRWEGRNYPEAFTRDEQDFIASFLPSDELKISEVKYRLERRATSGKLCHSGRVYANLKPNGDLYRCGQVEAGPIGNIFDPEFRLYDAPKPCPYQHCSCQEFRYLDEVFVENERAY